MYAGNFFASVLPKAFVHNLLYGLLVLQQIVAEEENPTFIKDRPSWGVDSVYGNLYISAEIAKVLIIKGYHFSLTR
jgi:hypothetical protein